MVAYIKYIYFQFCCPTQLQRYHLPSNLQDSPLRCWKLELPPSWPLITEGNVWMWPIYPGWWRRHRRDSQLFHLEGRDGFGTSNWRVLGWVSFFFGRCNLIYVFLYIPSISQHFFFKGCCFLSCLRKGDVFFFLAPPLSSIKARPFSRSVPCRWFPTWATKATRWCWFPQEPKVDP